MVRTAGYMYAKHEACKIGSILVPRACTTTCGCLPCLHAASVELPIPAGTFVPAHGLGVHLGRPRSPCGKTMVASLRYPHWVIDGRVFDLTPFIPKHPGGARWFARSHGRDISAAVHHYHSNPRKVRRLLDRYEVSGISAAEALDPGLNVPPFILPEAFDARAHTPEIIGDAHAEDALLADVHRVIHTPHMRTQLRRADLAFDTIAVILLIIHLVLAFPAVASSSCEGWLGATLVCVGLVLTRTALAAVGHYHCHRAKDGWTDWADALFDIQYVGASLVLFDGHVLLHHLYTQSHADVKRTVFTAMLGLPRLWRIPVFSMMRMGNLLSGMWVRYVTFSREPEPAGSHWPPIKHASFLALRALLLWELWHAVRCNRGGLWLAQFLLVIWLNQLLIVASHDFELPSSDADANVDPSQAAAKTPSDAALHPAAATAAATVAAAATSAATDAATDASASATPSRPSKRPQRHDWAEHQVRVSFDMSVTGYRPLDLFLTAGLSSHRAHHVLPYQRSGFANLLSEPALQAACEKHNVPWEPTRSFPCERLPILLRHYFLSPPRGRLASVGLLRETFDVPTLRLAAELIFFAFLGEGGI